MTIFHEQQIYRQPTLNKEKVLRTQETPFLCVYIRESKQMHHYLSLSCQCIHSGNSRSHRALGMVHCRFKLTNDINDHISKTFSMQVPSQFYPSRTSLPTWTPLMSCKVILAGTIAKSLLAEVNDGLATLNGRKPHLRGILGNRDPAARVYADFTARTSREKWVQCWL